MLTFRLDFFDGLSSSEDVFSTTHQFNSLEDAENYCIAFIEGFFGGDDSIDFEITQY
jgi:hypothetical protein